MRVYPGATVGGMVMLVLAACSGAEAPQQEAAFGGSIRLDQAVGSDAP